MTIKFDIFYNAKDKKHINCMEFDVLTLIVNEHSDCQLINENKRFNYNFTKLNHFSVPCVYFSSIYLQFFI